MDYKIILRLIASILSFIGFCLMICQLIFLLRKNKKATFFINALLWNAVALLLWFSL
jgi:hypothetical protein